MEMLLKLSIFLILALCHITSAVYPRTKSDESRPNVIIMHVNNMHWSDLGIHVNKADNENSTPNIDRLAYAGIILNRFYGNGGKDSLHSGCYQRSTYGNGNLLTTYFERDGYNVNSVAVTDFRHVELFERQVLALISSSISPFLLTVDFGYLGVDIKVPLVDDIVGAMIMKAHEAGIIDNTIVIFVSLPDDSKDIAPVESNIRRSAFIYSPLLSLQQRVSNQLFHISDILPTLIEAAGLKWRTKDRYFIDGKNQWKALNTNDDVRVSIYGDNFYISNNWKLSYGTTSNEIYDSSSNLDMESDKNEYDASTYIKSLLSAEIHVILGEMPARQIMLMRNRAKVHCNVNGDEADESFLLNIKCSQVSPCLFDLLNDPCELDDKHEAAYELKRNEMKIKLEKFLRKGETESGVIKNLNDDLPHNDHNISDGIDPILTPSGGIDAFITLGLTLLAFIFVFGIIVCFKERCNTRRSVYGSKVTFKDESGKKKEDYVANRGITTVSSQVERTHL